MTMPAKSPSTAMLNSLASYIEPFLRNTCPDTADVSQVALATLQSLGPRTYPQLLAATRTIVINLGSLEMLAAIVKHRQTA
jgi:hypothetical protein